MIVNKDIKDALKSRKLLMGSKTVLRGVKGKLLNTVIYASNCPDDVIKDLNHYSKISGVKLEEFNGNSVQLGEICGRPFAMLMVGVKKDKK
jgi:large subunit ribosomal protein L30e